MLISSISLLDKNKALFKFDSAMVKISIITPILNGRSFIRQTVESVLSQSGDFELEYIIRDGGSTDGTLEILDEYQDRCRVFSEPDDSPQEAINQGMNMATGEIGGWLNGDDIYRPGALQAVADLFSRRHDCRWCYGRCRIIDNVDRSIRWPISLYKHLLGAVYSRNVLLCENYISQPAVFWRLDLWHQLGGLNSAYLAAWDYELWLKMAAAARPEVLRRTLACFRRHPDSISENNFEQQFEEELQIARFYGRQVHVGVHRFNCWKIVTAYNILARK